MINKEKFKKNDININNNTDKNKNENIAITNQNISNNNLKNLNKDNEKDNNSNNDLNTLVYDSSYLSKTKIKDYNGLYYELKMLEIELYRRNRIKNCNNVGLIEEINLEVANMREKLEINDSGYDFNNISEIFNIIGIIKKSPEERRMLDLLKIVKYLTVTKLGQYFREEFEQKEIFEKLITFCGVEMRYKFFKKGDTIFKIGDLPDYFYLLLLGKVDILKPLQKKMMLTGYQYFCYLMDLKKNNEEYLLNLCIKENESKFYIQKEDIRDIDYIYILIIVDKISRHQNVNFEKALNITGISCKELDLDPDRIYSNKYLLDNIKKIKRRLPINEGSHVQKYSFFDDKWIKKEIAIFNYYIFLTLEEKSYFGDSAMDSNSTRNATIVATEDTHVAFFDNSLYYKNVVVEKAAIFDKKLHFLNSNFIFGKIDSKKFEKNYLLSLKTS
jgi:CRP-like cAMP-binding protein